jgi:hypothetical protein
LDARRQELNLSLVELDYAAQHAPGTAGKYLSPEPNKGLGVESFFKLAKALGLEIVLEINPKATESLLERSRPRSANQVRPGNLSQVCGKRTLERALRHLAALDWSETIATVAEARRKMAEEEAEKAAKEAAAASKAAAKPAVTQKGPPARFRLVSERERLASGLR